MDGESIVVRGVAKTDMPFIYKSILLGTYHGNRYGKGGKSDSRAPVDYFSSIPQDVFMSKYHEYLDVLFTRPTAECRIACLNSDPDVILGFCVYETHPSMGPIPQESVLHFVFVKPQWRGIGIATQLVPKTVTTVTGFTRVGDIIRKKKNWFFNPWA